MDASPASAPRIPKSARRLWLGKKAFFSTEDRTKLNPMLIKWFFLLSIFSLAGSPGNNQIKNFNVAKKISLELNEEYPFTVYCRCRYEGKRVDLKSCGYEAQKDPRRAARLEWEHVVPAEAFGQSFSEWREGAPQCRHKKSGRRFKGRKCAETNAEFSRMEADLYNLWPIIGELNGLRSNYSMAEISGPSRTFGGCKAKIQNRKFEPEDQDKGLVARVYLYMESAYPGHGIISNKNRKLFEAWDKLHPPSEWECKRATVIARKQGNENPVLKSRCEPEKARISGS